ncbi:ankyrin repeat domain-containing protein [Sulfurospirillum sp. T05]|uniref:Ankyrin repeat domain-containing protein n=1 Tax=Sulfurospirillum tamanense TaxID=2813362 RepID=A0ABS2WNM0_9BACT|nr:ankyrin repeat domain-containing protein [Sulfurospirillum tamanensis]MBN2963281.1 ankyrin repeat domain-containing protein [Sulfurospirillum tamanensis]
MHVTPEEEARYEELQHMALDFARGGHTVALMAMVGAGMSVNLCDAKGNTLLMLSAYHNHLKTAQALLLQGANVDQKNDRGQTPLAGVCFKGYDAMAKLLLEHGANPYENNGLGATPVTFALLFGRRELAQTLIRHGGKKPSVFERFLLGFGRWFSSKKSSA